MAGAFFVTGTDTEVGKTTIAAGLLHAARQAGLSTAAAKPVASGCVRTPEGLRNDDALALLAECTLPLAYEAVNPFAFEPAIAPHLAAREAGIELSAACLAAPVQQTLALQADFTLVEGAGGWRAGKTCPTWRSCWACQSFWWWACAWAASIMHCSVPRPSSVMACTWSAGWPMWSIRRLLGWMKTSPP